MTLHLIQKSPFATSVLTDCLNLSSQQDAILLMQDGVYAHNSAKLANSKLKTFVLKDDLDARGISANNDNTQVISYDEFVSLCTQYTNIISWY